MAELPSSKLGTKAHWDEVYEREINTFKEIGEEGEIWFGEDAVETLGAWCLDHCEARESLRILDVGCGNGHLLFSLLQDGYAAEGMLGVDYSLSSVQLCQDIAASRAREGLEGADRIQWRSVDILDRDAVAQLGGQFDLILDKGTFDAICLAPRDDAQPHPSSLYAPNIKSLLSPDGLFCITSCNWTQEELEEKFTKQDSDLELHSSVPKPRFMFGGQTGQTTCTVAFQRKRQY